MTQIKDNIIDRDALQASYIDRIIDGMDLKDLMQIVYDQLDDSLDKYSVDELIEEVRGRVALSFADDGLSLAVTRGETVLQPK